MTEKQIAKQQEFDLYDELWRRLPIKKFCVSCDTPIWGANKSFYWDHLLEKNEYPEFRLDERNIYGPVCGDCHSCKSKGFPTPKHAAAIAEAKRILLNE